MAASHYTNDQVTELYARFQARYGTQPRFHDAFSSALQALCDYPANGNLQSYFSMLLCQRIGRVGKKEQAQVDSERPLDARPADHAGGKKTADPAAERMGWYHDPHQDIDPLSLDAPDTDAPFWLKSAIRDLAALEHIDGVSRGDAMNAERSARILRYLWQLTCEDRVDEFESREQLALHLSAVLAQQDGENAEHLSKKRIDAALTILRRHVASSICRQNPANARAWLPGEFSPRAKRFKI